MTAEGVHPQTDRPASRRAVVRSVARSLLTTTGLVWLYFYVPVKDAPSGPRVVLLVVGILLPTAVLVWQVRAIVRSRTPRLRALETLATVVPLFLLLFALFYYVLGLDDTTQFSQPLSRVDALYLTITIFATVGFGDIVAVSQAARVAVIVQMIVDVILIGFGLRVLLRAVQIGLTRQPGSTPRDEG